MSGQNKPYPISPWCIGCTYQCRDHCLDPADGGNRVNLTEGSRGRDLDGSPCDCKRCVEGEKRRKLAVHVAAASR
jgi:hypothetical protein